MALDGPLCADVPLRTYTLAHFCCLKCNVVELKNRKIWHII